MLTSTIRFWRIANEDIKNAPLASLCLSLWWRTAESIVMKLYNFTGEFGSNTSTHPNFGQGLTKVTGILHEDPHVFLHTILL
jgi:hypothetical protein